MARALKLVLMDASALLDLAKGELKHDYAMPPSHQSGEAQVVEHVLRTLSRDHTVVISREVLNEILPSVAGCLDLERDENGKPQFPKHRYPLQIRQPDSLVLYNALEALDRDGQVRAYASTTDMLRAGEVSAMARGGIVIVDSKVDEKLWRPITREGERRYPSRTYEKQATPFPDIEELRVSATPSTTVTSAEPVIAPHPDLSLQQVSEAKGIPQKKGNPYRDLGDKSMLRVANDIANYAIQQKLPRHMLFVNGDVKLTRAMRDQQRHQGGITIVYAHELLWGLAMEQQLSSNLAHSMTNALELERQDRGRVLVGDQDKFVNAVRGMQKWLNDETQPAPTSSHTARLDGRSGQVISR